MGISGLHQVLKPHLQPSHARFLSGHRVAVDASGWLHRGAVGCAGELAQGLSPWKERGYDAPYVNFCLKMVATLQAANVTPVLVFDGQRLPAKAGTNQQRRQRRQEAKERGLRLLAEGREAEAQQAFMGCISVTSDMAHELILRLRERRIEYVVAPYEADPQLAYLTSIPEHEGGVAAVVTEDSDLVAYGVRRILFKMDREGHCWELSLDRLFAGQDAAAAAATAAGGGAAKGGGKGKGGGALSLKGWTLEMLQAACVLAGCDFLPSLKGISFKTAAGFVGRRRNLAGALKAIRLERRFQSLATQEYCAAAAQALLAFQHALVFCANTAGGSCRRLTPLPAGSEAAQAEELAHLGAEVAVDVARGIAYGHLHPHTLEPFPVPASGGAAQQQQQRQRQQQQPAGHRHHQQQQQQQRQQPSLASRKQASWMATGAAQQPGQHGLGPSQPLPPPMLRQLERQWEGMALPQHGSASASSADVSDVAQLYQQPPPPQQQQRQQRQPVQQLGCGECWRSSTATQPPDPCSSMAEADTAVVVSPASDSVAAAECSGQVQQAQAQQLPPQQRQAMHPITNRSQQQQQPPPPQRVWDKSEQYRPQQQYTRATPPAAVAGSKRKSSGGGGGSSKKAAKPLAPPAQRISRFFEKVPKQAAAQR